MQKSRLIPLLIALLPVIVVAIFVGIPALMALAYSLGFIGGPNAAIALLDQHLVTPEQGLTLKVYQDLLRDRSFLQNFWATIWVTIASVALILVVSWGLALYIRFSHGWFPHIISSIYLVPLFIPVVIASYAIVTFWNANGYVSALVARLGMHFPGFGYTLFGVVIGQLWVNLPFAILMIVSGLQAVPDALIEAARDVGAPMSRILLRVILPLNILPTVITGTFTGIGVLGSFTVPYIIGPTAPSLLGVAMASYFQAYNAPQQAIAMAVIVFILAAALGIVYVRANVVSDRKAGTLQ
ncbi:ABC transporter permease subunit [Ktedonosporobacter rubrisoli]|uniref:ABC transporter permease subunit n=1 Tax=Ktedonosporobacter rubrisoli TaxID=2509675 RepID=A0A4P6K372_KTERU|nr:ABC transporter permease subunit [Ktedonosporobacter rubrisoli]QBD82343.1 ABC transporter permease subunit [Ktedonosporobacter rubrisoli]